MYFGCRNNSQRVSQSHFLFFCSIRIEQFFVHCSYLVVQHKLNNWKNDFITLLVFGFIRYNSGSYNTAVKVHQSSKYVNKLNNYITIFF